MRVVRDMMLQGPLGAGPDPDLVVCHLRQARSYHKSLLAGMHGFEISSSSPMSGSVRHTLNSSRCTADTTTQIKYLSELIELTLIKRVPIKHKS